jgi:putative MFS transporter
MADGGSMLASETIAARLDRLPVARFHIELLVIAAASLLFDALDGLVITLVLTHLRTIWHVSVATIGIVTAIAFGGYLLGAAASGFVADRIGRKKTILATLILYSLFSASRGFANDVPTLAALNFITFIFIGAESCIVPPYLAEFWPARVRGKLNGATTAFFGLGIALAPIWALLIIPNLGWRWAFFLTLPFAMAGGLMRVRLPESPRWLSAVGRKEDAEIVVAKIEETVRRQSARPLPPVANVRVLERAQGHVRIRARDILSSEYRGITVMLWAAWFAEFAILYMFQTFVPTILAAEGFVIVRSFVYLAVIYGALIPGYVIGGQTTEWLDRKYALLLAFFGMALFGTLFGVSTQSWQFLLFGGATTFFTALGSTSIYTYTPELYPTEIRVTGMGIASAWGRVGAITALLLFGLLYKSYGKPLLFIISDVLLVVGALFVAVLGPPTRGRGLELTSQGVDLPQTLALGSDS